MNANYNELEGGILLRAFVRVILLEKRGILRGQKAVKVCPLRRSGCD